MPTISSSVAIVKGEQGHELVFKALDLINCKGTLAGWNKILVDFIAGKTWDTGATIDPIVVEAILST